MQFCARSVFQWMPLKPCIYHLQAYDVMHQCEDANKWDIPLASLMRFFDFTEQRTAKAVPGNEG